ncbi:hypothetical protein [Pseudobacteriovorax antillogorgiicola]|uniref:MotA/TolQ/ExbB proton channel family protein n=1 Tax=Pseudobacteriovorax antillogorgiicola TaxID=1513793 RepID=A0A1Y6CGM2_9BACT|nr:hypothetical protein [Pseudobacteriovorax antillogorgiicola]TCS47329.1 hypothetical protein EDD56_121104 [Pseudobacteriovorax antillogorgiicola]SMF62969.1 hypothetical protein SAMN06296036_121104 [Pseudobacteriovorax antillogorgiicola]
MSVIEIFNIAAAYLIQIMAITCVIALILRYIAHNNNKVNKAYFNSFSHAVIKQLEEEEAKHESVDDVEIWLENLLYKIEEHLPDRSLRFRKTEEKQKQRLSEFTDSKRSVILAIKQQVDALKSPHPPNFMELADRVLNQDPNWRNILKILPVNSLNRGLDLLPNLFIVGGIFGTFVGITSALPMIAQIDITKLDEAAPVLNAFVGGVAYSMNTSIAGIVFSVTMTLITSLFPLASVRNEVSKNFERAIEFMWYRIHGNKLSHGEYKMIEAIENLRKSNQEAVKLLAEIRDIASQDSSQPPSDIERGAS